MPTLRERAARILTGPSRADAEREQLQEMTQMLLAAYQEGPYILPPEELQRQLIEQYDSEYVLDLVDRLQWEQFGGYQSGLEDQRIRAVNDSKRMWLYSVVAQWIVRLWTYYAVGESIEVIPTDDTYTEENERSAQVVWGEFWAADRNSPVLATERLHDISNMLLVTGNRFFAFFLADQDGEATIRRVKPLEIVEIIKHPKDDSVPLFYRRQWLENSTQKTEYYPDWRWWFDKKYDTDALPKDSIVAERDETSVVMLHAPFEQKDEDSLFGWPLLAPAGTPWLRSHRQFFENRLAVSRSVASYVRRKTVKGGSRAVDAVRATLMSSLQGGASTETNPPPVTGSTEVENQAVSTQDLPLRTGASDAKTDGEMFSWMAGLSGGVYPHYLGLGDAYRLATATSMEKPMFMQFSLYRNRLSAIFRDMVRIVLQSKEKYGGVEYETYEARIAADRLVELDLELIASAAGGMFANIINPQQAAGTMPAETLMNTTVYSIQSILQAMGAEDVPEMVNKEQYEKRPEETELEEWMEKQSWTHQSWCKYLADDACDCGGHNRARVALAGGEDWERLVGGLAEQKPQGQPLPEWPDEPVPISDKDIDDAIQWAQDMDPELAAMLQATSDEAEAREAETGPGKGWWGPPTGTHAPESQSSRSTLGNADYAASLPNDQAAAITSYVGSDYRKINGDLRSGSLNDDDIQVKLIDKAIAASPPVKEATVYRALAMSPQELGLEVGTVFTDKAYVSTTKSSTYLYTKLDKLPTRCVIKVPKPVRSEVRGMHVQYLSGKKAEQEILFARGSSFKVTAIEKQGDYMKVDLEMILP